MVSDYATLLLAILLGYQLAAPLWRGSRASAWDLLALLASFLVLGLVPALSFTGLRVGWLFSGSLLTYQAVARMRQRGRVKPVFLAVLDGAGAWAALVLAGSSPSAVLAGGSAGIFLAIAIGPWPRWLERTVEPAEWLLMGAIGLRTLVAAAWGPQGETWPILLMMVPGLILWDVVGGTRSAPPTR